MTRAPCDLSAHRQDKTVAAIIDLDGTLYDGYIWQALTRHHLRNRFKILNLVVYLIPHLSLYPLFRVGWISADYFYRSWGENMAWLVRGVPTATADRIWDWLWAEEICPRLRPEILSAVRTHQAQGHQVILLSGTFQPLLETLAERLAVDAAIATPIAEKDGRYLGEIVPPLNIGEAKAQRLLQYCDGLKKQIDLRRSYFYTDSIVDLPVLQRVGNPVAVFPDSALGALAEKWGWQVIGGPKKTP